jgi:hypothetical protein
MIQIVLNDEQMEALRKAGEEVEIRDPNGGLLGYLDRPFDDEEILAEADRRLNSDGPWYTTEQVLEHLRSLERK